ncbi:hypothetical protein ACFX2C_020541 [Malus domestica]
MRKFPRGSIILIVNSTTSSSIFYTFYEAQSLEASLDRDPSQTLLLVWLRGSLGCSSLFGNFMEIGPWHDNLHAGHDDHDQQVHFVLESNPGAWNRVFGLIFLDNPISSEFSIAPLPC